MSNDKMPYAADLAPSEARVPRGASPAAYGMGSSDTFPRLLARLATERADATALQEKRYGIWQPLTWAQYWSRVRDFAHGLGKSFVFAWIIGLAGCHLGMRAGGDAGSVGHATTRTVVASIFLIILVDAVFATVSTLMRNA